MVTGFISHGALMVFGGRHLGMINPFIKGEAGPEKLMRDPFVFPARDGSFHLVWTAGWRGKGIGYSSSLVHFPPGAQHGSVVKIWLEQIRHLF